MAGSTPPDRPAPFRFYAAEVSYFSAKVRPALRYKGLPVLELLADPRAYREVILPRTGLAFIPVVITPEGETWQDSSDILDELEARWPEPPLYPPTPVQRLVSHLIELYADEFLLLPAMHYRWSFPESEAKARADFAAVTGDPDSARAFADRIKTFVPALGVVPATASAIEAHARGLLADLSAHLSRHAYLLGQRPSLGDCALMGPLYAHLYLDAVPGRLLRETAPRVCHWIERMNHPDPDASGAWVPRDELPDTLRPLIERIGADAVPVLLDTVRAFESWADSRPADLDTPPRAVGTHRTTLHGVDFERYTSAYTLWMVQRCLDAYRSLAPREREAADRAFRGTGCEALFAHAPRHRLGKRRFRLVFDET
jgi:glutathione S-transferase